MTSPRRAGPVRAAVYLLSLLLHGGLWQGVRTLEPPPPPPPPPVKITVREAPPEPEIKKEPEPPPPEPEPSPEAPPTDAPPPVAKPEPAPSKPKKQKAPTPEPAEAPPTPAAPPDFGVQMGNGASGPGGTSVPAGDPGGSGSGGRERVESKARKLDAKPKKEAADACADPEVRPTPLEIPQPPYSDAARTAGVEGKVRVQLAISADGSVSSVKVVTPLHPDLDEAARVAMKSARFTPATRCGKPVATTLTISVKFTL